VGSVSEERRLLLTGATGFLGRHILSAAIKAGYEVHASARNAGKRLPSSASSVTWHHLDLRDRDAAEVLVKKVAPSHMVNAAWDTRHGTYWTSDENQDWLATASSMIVAFGRSGGRRFVQIGTCAEYAWGSGEPLDESAPEVPATPYGRAKLAVHRFLQEEAARTGFEAATARIFFAFGPHENPSRLIPALCRALHERRNCRIANPGQVRDPLFVTDAALAVVAILESMHIRGAVNVGSGDRLTLGEVGRFLETCSGTSGLLDLNSDESTSTDMLAAEISKLRSTGWTSSVSIWQGLRKSYQWWSTSPDPT
jgi:nucleoside-diphosphate-sugar epimerase